RAHAVAVRHTELPTGEGVDHRLDPGPDAGEPRPFAFEDDLPAFHRTGMEIRFVDGGADRPGPARAWFRLRRPVVGDEEPSGVQRVAAAADFSNGISWVLPFADWIFLNPDLTLHLARPPAGEWIGRDAVTVPSDQGMGMAESAVYDEKGRLGRAVQSLLLQRRPAGQGRGRAEGAASHETGRLGRPGRGRLLQRGTPGATPPPPPPPPAAPPGTGPARRRSAPAPAWGRAGSPAPGPR